MLTIFFPLVQYYKTLKAAFYHLQEKISAENAFFAIFRLKFQTLTTMPLKVGFFPGFRRLLTDLLDHFKGISPKIPPKFNNSIYERYLMYIDL
jgi:hypothetical protein